MSRTDHAAHPQGRRGNYSMIMGLIMAIVIGFGALSVDVSLITMAKLQAQAAADAASHAALVTFHKNNQTSEGITAANFIVNKDVIAMGTGRMHPGDPTFGNWDFHAAVSAFSPGLDANGNANAVRVTVDRNTTAGNAVDLLLAPILGIPTADVAATSITAQEMRAIMMVNDLSCSMMYFPGTAIINSHDADQAFFDYIASRPQAGDQLGLAVYAQTGSKAATGTAPYNTSNPNDAPWIPLQLIAGSSAFTSGINGICNTTDPAPCGGGSDPHPLLDDIGGCTNPQIALNQAIHQILTKTSAPYFRGIIFESDGLPNCDTGGGFDIPAAQAAAQSAANTAWANDISIWAILFHNGSFDVDFMQSMVRGIGFFQDSPDSADLPEMYRQVARSLPTAFVF